MQHLAARIFSVKKSLVKFDFFSGHCHIFGFMFCQLFGLVYQLNAQAGLPNEPRHVPCATGHLPGPMGPANRPAETEISIGAFSDFRTTFCGFMDFQLFGHSHILRFCRFSAFWTMLLLSPFLLSPALLSQPRSGVACTRGRQTPQPPPPPSTLRNLPGEKTFLTVFGTSQVENGLYITQNACKQVRMTLFHAAFHSAHLFGQKKFWSLWTFFVTFSLSAVLWIFSFLDVLTN